ncbi:MAG: MmcQ/YjbR family DNA-binding protein [Betaproteobacteria bacterium]|nr:MmcQ/YjbR family DNA-binding protein [Betaproteobacteria bacterium]
MTPAALRAFCLKLPAATYDLKWGQDHVYSVGGKMFAVVFEARKGAETVSFKVDDGRFLELTDRPGLVPAPYLARAKWVQLTSLAALGDAELKALLARSHALVCAKLTRADRVRLGLEAAAPKKR